MLLKAAKKLSAQDVDLFENRLVSHTKDIEQQDREQFERILLSAKAVHSYSKTDIDLSSIVDYFGKVRSRFLATHTRDEAD